MELAMYVTIILEIFLLAICIICNITEAIKPETKALTIASPFILLATLAIFPMIFWFFGLFFDFSIFWDMIKGIPSVLFESLNMCLGCPFI